ncbi:MAG TPA: hypothetical protein VG938_03355 [Verrucomicrobiae bacterium]|nr:hypothetical protein [Verrucomicrobiae bacterium]
MNQFHFVFSDGLTATTILKKQKPHCRVRQWGSINLVTPIRTRPPRRQAAARSAAGSDLNDESRRKASGPHDTGQILNERLTRFCSALWNCAMSPNGIRQMMKIQGVRKVEGDAGSRLHFPSLRLRASALKFRAA